MYYIILYIPNTKWNHRRTRVCYKNWLKSLKYPSCTLYIGTDLAGTYHHIAIFFFFTNLTCGI